MSARLILVHDDGEPKAYWYVEADLATLKIVHRFERWLRAGGYDAIPNA